MVLRSFLLLVLLIPFSVQAQLSEKEKQIVQYLEKSFDQSRELLKKIVEINSGSLNVEGVREVGRVLKAEFNKLGMETRWLQMPKEMKRAGHLFAHNKGESRKKLLLIGHLDTVFEKDSEFQKLKKKGNYFYGPGVNDMKGGIVAMVMALRALKEVNALSDSQITVALMGDEENPGEPIKVARSELIKIAKQADYALGFEYGVNSINFATIARRGYSNWELKLDAKRGHSSRIYSENFGPGANNLLAMFLTQAMKAAQKREGVTFNPAIIAGGSKMELDKQTAVRTSSKDNIIASRSYARGDIRTLTTDDYQAFQNDLNDILKKLPKPNKANLKFISGAPPMAEKSGNHQLLKKLSQVSVDLGLGKVEALDPKLRGAADSSYVANHVDGVIDGIGLFGDGAHSFEERIEIESFKKVIKRTAIFLYRLSR